MNETERPNEEIEAVAAGFVRAARALGLNGEIVSALTGPAPQRDRIGRMFATTTDDGVGLPIAAFTDEAALVASLSAMHPERLSLLLAAEPEYIVQALAAAPPALLSAAVAQRVRAALAGRADESPVQQERRPAAQPVQKLGRLLRVLARVCPDLSAPVWIRDPEHGTPVGSPEDAPYYCLCLLGARTLGRSLAGAAPQIRARAAHTVGPVFEAEVAHYAACATAEERQRARAHVETATLRLGRSLETQKLDERLAAIGAVALVASARARQEGQGLDEVERLRWLLPPALDTVLDWCTRGPSHV